MFILVHCVTLASCPYLPEQVLGKMRLRWVPIRRWPNLIVGLRRRPGLARRLHLWLRHNMLLLLLSGARVIGNGEQCLSSLPRLLAVSSLAASSTNVVGLWPRLLLYMYSGRVPKLIPMIYGRYACSGTNT